VTVVTSSVTDVDESPSVVDVCRLTVVVSSASVVVSSPSAVVCHETNIPVAVVFHRFISSVVQLVNGIYSFDSFLPII